MKKLTKLGFALALVLAACGDGDDDDHDHEHDSTPDMDSTQDAADEETPEERGAYLVNHVLVCGDCHTPRLQNGSPDTTKFLAGSPSFADILPAANMGNVPAPNLTPHVATGIGDWTDAEIAAAFTEGVNPDGGFLFGAMMPYWMFHNLTDDDVAAVVAYLRTIPAVDNDVGEREDLGFTVAQDMPIPEPMFPESSYEASDADYDKAQNGRYLAMVVCVECHTPATAPGSMYPIDTTMLYAGGRTFAGADFGGPPLPEDIYTRNITPHMNGLMGWAPANVKTVLHMGTDIEGVSICPPMPVGPMGGFAGMTDHDAESLGHYFTSIPPVASDDYPECPLLPSKPVRWAQRR